MEKWKVLESRTLFKNQWFDLMYHYLAINCRWVAAPQLQFEGEIKVWDEDQKKVFEKIRKGEILHSYTVEGLLRAFDWLRVHRKKRPPRRK